MIDEVTQIKNPSNVTSDPVWPMYDSVADGRDGMTDVCNSMTDGWDGMARNGTASAV